MLFEIVDIFINTPQERLEHFIGRFYHNKTDFARALGVSLANLNKYLGKDASILGSSYHSKMIELNLNPTWYTTGQGNMLFNSENEVISKNVNPFKRSPFPWLAETAIAELQDLLNITLYLTPEAKMGQALSFNEIPSTITTLKNFIAPNAKNISAIIARGDSMIEDGIIDGDVILFDAGAMPRNKQIIVAEYNESILVKRFVKRDDGSIFLESSNEKFKPIKISEDEHFRVIGICRSILRNPF